MFFELISLSFFYQRFTLLDKLNYSSKVWTENFFNILRTSTAKLFTEAVYFFWAISCSFLELWNCLNYDFCASEILYKLKKQLTGLIILSAVQSLRSVTSSYWLIDLNIYFVKYFTQEDDLFFLLECAQRKSKLWGLI